MTISQTSILAERIIEILDGDVQKEIINSIQAHTEKQCETWNAIARVLEANDHKISGERNTTNSALVNTYGHFRTKASLVIYPLRKVEEELGRLAFELPDPLSQLAGSVINDIRVFTEAFDRYLPSPSGSNAFRLAIAISAVSQSIGMLRKCAETVLQLSPQGDGVIELHLSGESTPESIADSITQVSQLYNCLARLLGEEPDSLTIIRIETGSKHLLLDGIPMVISVLKSVLPAVSQVYRNRHTGWTETRSANDQLDEIKRIAVSSKELKDAGLDTTKLDASAQHLLDQAAIRIQQIARQNTRIEVGKAWFSQPTSSSNNTPLLPNNPTKLLESGDRADGDAD